MYCKKCQTQNEESAQFCSSCGARLDSVQQNAKSENLVSSTLLLVYVLITFFVTVVTTVFYKVWPIQYWEFPWRYFIGSIWIVNNLIFILPALAIKKIPMKIIGIIFASIVIIIRILDNINLMFRIF
ncbi:MAG: zinc ribbon domain-containing protein [Bacteroidales bacterium]|jgi:hypothetical protein|nr:zinc ribbon domain-containing protein [Bacteroidales bacterium]